MTLGEVQKVPWLGRPGQNSSNVLAALTMSAALVGVILGWSAKGEAAGCCGGNSGVGDRLTTGEVAAARLGLRQTERLGVWTSEGDLAFAKSGQLDRELRMDASVIARAGKQLQLSASFPLIYTWKQTTGDLASSGGGFGDVVASARYELPVFQRTGPGIALSFAALIPTGRPSHLTDDLLEAGTTGLGAAEFRPGLSVEKTWSCHWYATINGSAGFRTPHRRRDGAEVQLSPRYQISSMTGPAWSRSSITAGPLIEIESGPAIDGRVAAHSTRYRTAVTVAGSYSFSDEWTGVLSVSADVPIAGLGHNEPVAVSPYLGIRYAWFE